MLGCMKSLARKENVAECTNRIHQNLNIFKKGGFYNLKPCCWQCFKRIVRDTEQLCKQRQLILFLRGGEQPIFGFRIF